MNHRRWGGEGGVNASRIDARTNLLLLDWARRQTQKVMKHVGKWSGHDKSGQRQVESPSWGEEKGASVG